MKIDLYESFLKFTYINFKPLSRKTFMPPQKSLVDF
jgi:hypothetical protein